MKVSALAAMFVVSSACALPGPDLHKAVDESNNLLGGTAAAFSPAAASVSPAGVPVNAPQDLPVKIEACFKLLAKDPPPPCKPPLPTDTCKQAPSQARWQVVGSGQLPALRDDLTSESAITAIDRTMRYWKARPGQCAQIGDFRMVRAEEFITGLEKLRGLLSTVKDPTELGRQLESNFAIYHSLPSLGTEQSQFTGYFVPDVQLSDRGGAEMVPVLGRPKDLARNPDANSCPRYGRYDDSHRFVPYYKRREIMSIQSSDLGLWVRNPAELYSMQTEGSAFGVFPDGRKQLLGNAGSNGYKWRGLAGVLRRCGIADTQDAQQLYDYIKELRKTAPGLERKIVELDDSYAFFEKQSGGPRGAANIELIPGRSIAVDPACIPLGLPGLLVSTLPVSEASAPRPFARFVFSHDIGGAIQGCARADLYMGDGPEAESNANRMNQPGGLFVIVPK